MSLHRVTLVAVATFLTAGMTTGAFAGCCDWGASAPLGYGWSGGWGSGCGGCGTSFAPVTYTAQMTYSVPVTVSVPVVYSQPIAPAPIYVGGGCGCGGSVAYAMPQVARSPIYVVNQGPEYSGPGIMEPYRTYSPLGAYPPATDYPYLTRFHRPYYAGPRVAWHRPMYPRYYAPRYYRPMPRMYPHHVGSWRG